MAYDCQQVKTCRRSSSSELSVVAWVWVLIPRITRIDSQVRLNHVASAGIVSADGVCELRRRKGTIVNIDRVISRVETSRLDDAVPLVDCLLNYCPLGHRDVGIEGRYNLEWVRGRR